VDQRPASPAAQSITLVNITPRSLFSDRARPCLVEVANGYLDLQRRIYCWSTGKIPP
jgi:hypothetical protein